MKGRWFIITPIILYGWFMFWNYYPIAFYAALSVLFVGLFIIYNSIIYNNYYKPYIKNKNYIEKYYKDSYYDNYRKELAIQKEDYDKVKYYYIGFWLMQLYNCTLVPLGVGLEYVGKWFFKLCLYVDEKLTVKI